MGTILTAEDVAATTPTITDSAGKATSLLPDEVGQVKNTIKDLTEFARVVNDAITKVSEMRGIKKDSGDGMIRQSPTTESFKPTQHTIEVKEVPTWKAIDRSIVKAWLWDVVTVQADKLPQDFKDRKIGDVLGSNFKNFKYEIPEFGVELGADKLVDILNGQICEIIDKIGRGEVAAPEPAVVPQPGVE